MRFVTWFSVLFILITIPRVVAAEEITSFRADYEIKADASVEVTETIDYDFGFESRHGIFRTLGTNHAEPASAWYKDRFVEIKDVSVTMNNQPVPFTISGDDLIEIKIGDADLTITGHNLYVIKYTLIGALSYPDQGDIEFYWNVTGSDWPVNMALVTVNIDSEVPLLGGTCYVGEAGAKTFCEEGLSLDNSYQISNLKAGSEVTIAKSLSATTLPKVVNEKVNFAPFLLGLYLLTLVFTLVHLWRYERYYGKNRPIIAEYEPYPGVEPMMAGALIDDRLDARDISAAIVYLAEQGFIKIKKTTEKVVRLFNVTDYELELLRPKSSVPGQFLPKIIELFFKDETTVGKVAKLSDIKNSDQLRRANSLIISELGTAVRADLAAAGFFEDQTQPLKKFVAPLAVVVVVIILGANDLVPLSLAWFMIGLIALWLIAVAVKDRRRTAKGYEAMYQLLGFKLFLSVTDKERFDFHNAPERSPEQFMQYLPYAIAFGVEEKWAEMFRDMQISNPGWYEDAGSGGVFAATAFTNDLASFAGAVTTSTTASSGGGASGGGGGGGGGGSW